MYEKKEGIKMTKTKEKKIKGKFRLVGKSTLDSKKRVTLGNKIMIRKPLSKMKIDSFNVFVNGEGNILLVPLATIPSRELWVHQNPEIMKSLQKGLKEAKEGKVNRVKDLDGFFEDL
ncbi:MAG: hypothetical protein KJ995_07705 [Candidatus Omnitrophica bacterium]|nr:hypothetical protein [Candidatus Omnitrophota bacterium]MBU1852270.1 hypothetical protein [Candidatus Omnitrophota bacterium]